MNEVVVISIIGFCAAFYLYYTFIGKKKNKNKNECTGNCCGCSKK